MTFCLALRDAYCCSVCRTHSVLSGAGYKSTPSSTFRNHWKTLFFPQKCYETPIWDIGVDAKMQMRHIHYYYSLLYVALVTFAGWNFCKSHCFKKYSYFPPCLYWFESPLHLQARSDSFFNIKRNKKSLWQ